MRILAGMSVNGVTQCFLVPSAHRGNMPESDDRFLSYPQDKRGPRGVWMQARHLRRVISEFRPDVLFLHSTMSLFTLLLLKVRGLRVPVIYCPHGWATSQYEEGSPKAKFAAFIEGRLTGLADLTVNISQHDRDLATRLRYSGRHVLIENAVPPAPEDTPDELFSDDPEALHLLFIGRLDRQKGFDILQAAFAAARRRRPDLKLHVVGEAVRTGSQSQGDVEGVDFAGWVDASRIDGWYRSADAIVVPSRWEGFGLVVAEAMRNGTPVLCADRGALPSLVQEDETGHVFPLDAKALEELLVSLDKTKLRAMREACRSTYETRFSIERFRREIVTTYDQIAGRHALD